MEGFDADAFRKADRAARKRMLERKTRKELQKICRKLGVPCDGHTAEMTARLMLAR